MTAISIIHVSIDVSIDFKIHCDNMTNDLTEIILIEVQTEPRIY